MMPAKAISGEKVEGLSSVSQKLLLCMPISERSQAVTVVPTFAPMTTPMACRSCMMPELTKPTTMTVVADEDWMMAVTPAPSITALKGWLVRCSRIGFSLEPARFSNDSPMMCIPKRNMARPPIRLNKS